MKTVDFSKVTIRGENTNVYIAMDAQGNLFTTVSNVIEVFQFIVSRNFSGHLIVSFAGGA